jgi:hypothetical protein
MYETSYNLSSYKLPSLLNGCLTKETLDHVRKTDYSNQSYYMNGKSIAASNKSLFEILIKLSLCLVSIFASLFGNLLVLYTMFILPKLRKTFSQPNYQPTAFKQIHLPIKNIVASKNFHSHQVTTHMNLTNNKFLITSQSNLNSNQASNKRKSCSIVEISKHPYAPKSPYYRKTVNLFILNLLICDLMIVVWCSWVSC